MKKNLLVSFSGGETSAFMTWMCLNRPDFRERYGEVLVVFANTGQENEATLDFVDMCDWKFKFRTIWIEAVTDPRPGVGMTSRVVSRATADLSGRVFEDMIAKYGIPGGKIAHCSRNLKHYPITHHVEKIAGWQRGTYDTAIGIRSDEIDRLSSGARERGIVYPFVQWIRVTKPDVNLFWASQEFRLDLKGYQGNCVWCWKKSLRKHLTIMDENPHAFDFPERMEALYPTVGAEFTEAKALERGPVREGYRRTFFRGNLSTKDLRRIYEERKGTFERATDDAVVYPDDALDLSGGCVESCEPFE